MAHGFEDEVFRADADVVVQALVKGVGRDDGDVGLRRAAQRAQPANGFPAVDAGHGQVHQDGVRLQAGGQQIQTVVATGGGADFKAQRLQQTHQQFAVGLFVVHHQKAAALAGVAVARAAGGRHGCGLSGSQPHFRQEQPDAKHRADAGRAAHAEFAAHQVGEHLGNRQTQPRARRGHTRRVGAGEGFKNALALVVRQAGAGVFNVDQRHLAGVAHAQRDVALRGELDGVAQQVDENLPHAFFVGAHHHRQAAFGLKMKLQALGQRLELEQVGHFAHAVGKVHGLDVERELAAFDARDVQRAFDQREQMLAAALDDADGLPAVRRDGRVFAHELRVAQDAVERRAQLVADGADVAALGLVGVFGQALGLLQRFVGLAVRVDLLHEQMGLPVGLFLGHLPAFVRQHHPPGHQTGNDQQRQIGFDKARAQRRTRHARGLGQRLELVLVEQTKHAGQQRHDHQHHQ